jgi:hypothetical protein
MVMGLMTFRALPSVIVPDTLKVMVSWPLPAGQGESQ